MISITPEYIDYSELTFPDGCDELDWADVPGGYLNWVDYWMARFEGERAEKDEAQSMLMRVHRAINFAKLDIPHGELVKRVLVMLHRIRNLSQIVSEQRTYIHKLEDALGEHNKKVS